MPAIGPGTSILVRTNERALGRAFNHEAIERFRSLINNGQRTFVERRDGKVFEFENWGTPATREDIEGVGWVYGVEEYEARFKK